MKGIKLKPFKLTAEEREIEREIDKYVPVSHKERRRLERAFKKLRDTVSLSKLVFLFFLSLFLPLNSHATDVGFVPRTGVWFSKDAFRPDEAVKVYTVIINNQYYSFAAEVGFFDNDKSIGTVTMADLPKEFSRQIWVGWKPKEGEHRVTVRFEKATAIDEQGRREPLDVSVLNQNAGFASWLLLPPSAVEPPIDDEHNQPPTPLERTVSPSAERETQRLDEVEVIVKREGDSLVLSPTVEKQTIEDEEATTSTSLTAPLKEFAKSVEETAGKIDKTAGQVSGLYVKAGKVLGKGKNILERGRAGWEEAQAAWDNLAEDNEKRRSLLFIAVGLTVVAWVLWRRIKRLWRRDRWEE